jgi:hypothetical protein
MGVAREGLAGWCLTLCEPSYIVEENCNSGNGKAIGLALNNGQRV